MGILVDTIFNWWGVRRWTCFSGRGILDVGGRWEIRIFHRIYIPVEGLHGLLTRSGEALGLQIVTVGLSTSIETKT